MLWLYDSRDSLRNKRKLHILPLTSEGKLRAWDIVLAAEVPSEREDYQFLADTDVNDYEPHDTEMFNEYWTEYGWLLILMDDDAEIPHDAEVVSKLWE